MATKDSSRKSNSSAVFKVGTISLVFLITGYQAALFMGRSAVLRIEASRDAPDTVYVVREVTGEVTGTPAPGQYAETPVPGQYRRNSRHSSRVEEVRAATRKVESFRFNPNTVGKDDLMRLGFSEKQAQSIINYREKGGRFRRSEDFAKSYVVADSVYERLKPFIDIPRTDINKADSAAFDALPGIGAYFAARMVSYRKELGGYSYPEQLMDIHNFDEQRFNALKDLIECSPSEPYPIWTLPAEELRKHPYIRSWQAAKAIVLYRENTPREELSAEGIRAAGILPEENASRLTRCRLAEP